MKRILLSLTAVLFAVVGWAQSEWKDITSDYIKNAAMSIDKDQQTDWTLVGSPDKPGGLSIQLCKSEKKEFYIRYSS